MVWVAPQREIAAHLSRHPEVVRACEVVSEAVAHAAQALAAAEAYDTGKYTSGIETVRVGRQWRARAGTRSAAPIEGGTGIYGPKRRMIVAGEGKMFAFRTRLPPPGVAGRTLAGSLGGVERSVVIREHRGMPGRHIMERAGRAVAAGSPRLRYRARRSWELVA